MRMSWLPIRNGLIVAVIFYALIFGLVKVFASDIEVDEPQPSITKWRLDTVRFIVFTKTCEVWYRKGFMQNGQFIGTNQGHQILFIDRPDNPETPEDETSTEFTDLIQAINDGSNIKQTITNAVKAKLGIE